MRLFARVDRVDPERAVELVNGRRAVVVDVRGSGEWRAGRLRGAIHVPLGQLSTRMGKLPRDRTIITVCRSGHRSVAAARRLRRAGFEAASLSGGLEGWVGRGLPLEPRNGRVL